MELKPITVELDAYPAELHSYIEGASIFDSSCSPEARVVFIDKDGGYFLKSAPKGSLEREVSLTHYFHGKGLAANVLTYISDEKDWLLTEKIDGADCTFDGYLRQPERLATLIGERLAYLHSMDFDDCPVINHTEQYLSTVQRNYVCGNFDKSHFPDSFGYSSEEEAWAVVKADGHLLQNDTLLHGDYCLPNIILKNWVFSGFIDLDNGGIGDRHIDIFWGAWSLFFNLKTHKYRDRFFEAYGKNKIDDDILRVVTACEVFG